MTRASILAALMSLILAADAGAQCMLMNPSFEIAGQPGFVFGGWNQFGVVGSSTIAVHGSKAARVSGPNTGGWDVSAYWQAQNTVAGDVWKAAGYVRVPSSAPLAGQSRAIVNVEWRNSGGALISYESHDVATSSTPRDTSLFWSFTTAAAPAGTASARILVGVLQGPGDPQRDAIYDQVTFVKQTSPSLDAIQWNDFPSGRTLSFAGRTWRAKGTGVYGPGPSWFSSSPSHVYVDANDRLHLTVTQSAGTWYSTEVALVEALGYGDYVFTTRGRLDTLDPAVVLGLFVWEYGPCYDAGYLWWNPYNEVDIEYSRWGSPGSQNAQFVAQPYDWGGNLVRYNVTFAANEITSHAFRWLPDRVEFRAWRGNASQESPTSLVAAWTYTGPHIPRPDQPRVHLNLWQFTGPPTTTQEVVFEDFTFAPWPPALVAAPETPVTTPRVAALALAGENPTRGGARLRLALPESGFVTLTMHDVAGRLVRTLERGEREAGAHEIAWDGRDAAGAPVAPGVYLAHFATARASGVARLVVLR